MACVVSAAFQAGTCLAPSASRLGRSSSSRPLQRANVTRASPKCVSHETIRRSTTLAFIGRGPVARPSTVKVSAGRKDGDDLQTAGESTPAVEGSGKDTGLWSKLPMGMLAAAVPAMAPLAAGKSGLLGTGFDVSGPESVLQALGLLAFIVAVHEAGHFAAARLQGIHVKRFSVGFGPTLLKYQGPKVEYSLRAFPLGGFVSFPDDDPDSEFEPDDPDLLRNRPIPDRVLVISAGVIANFIFAYTVLFAQVATVGSAGIPEYLPGVKIPQVVRGSVAEAAGIESGDLIEAVNDAPVPADKGEVNRIVNKIRLSDGKPMKFSVVHNQERRDVVVVPELSSDGYGKIGVQLLSNVNVKREQPASLSEAASLAAKEWTQMTKTVAGGLLKIASNFEQSSKEVSGPVAIVAVGAEVARNDATGLFQFAALVNINLAVVNLLPFPGLDGGYLALASLEAIRGEKLEKEVEGSIMGSGVLLLLGTGMFVVLRDLLNLVK